MRTGNFSLELNGTDVFTVMDDDYRQPSPYSAGIFADSTNDHINECIARIETLKLKVLGNSRIHDFEQHEFFAVS